MKVVISRTYQKNQTIGSLFVLDGEKLPFKCKTIELPWLGNQRNCSCIPEGTYNCIVYNSPTKGKCFQVLNVPGRDNILIHKGNYASGRKVDTMGCILPGMGFADLNDDGSVDVVQSTEAMNKLLKIITGEFKLIII